MNLGKTIAGALVGAALGVVIQIAIEQALGYQLSWFPIITGLLTAFGVRKMDASTATTVSYVRGGVAAVIALVAIFVAVQAGSMVTMKRLSAANTDTAPLFESKPAASEASDDEASDDDAGDVEADDDEAGDVEADDADTDGDDEADDADDDAAGAEGNDEATAGDDDEGEDEAGDDAEEAPAPKPTLTLSQDASANKPLAPETFDTVAFICMALGTFLAYEFSRGSSPAEEGEPTDEESPQPVPATDDDPENKA